MAKDDPNKIINPYEDGEVNSFDEFDPDRDAEHFGEEHIMDVRELQVGFGEEVFRSDKQGIWLGAARFADAPFSVDMAGNVIALTFTATSLKTADTGQHIEIDSSPSNQIRFYDDATLFGLIEVDYDSGTDQGFINILAQDLNAGLQIDVGIGASSFSSVQLFANGGAFMSDGNASNHFLSMSGAFGGLLQVKSEFGSGDEQVYTDLDIDTDGLVNIPEMTLAQANARPFLRDGSMFYDVGTDEAKVRIAGVWVVFAS